MNGVLIKILGKNYIKECIINFYFIYQSIK